MRVSIYVLNELEKHAALLATTIWDYPNKYASSDAIHIGRFDVAEAAQNIFQKHNR
jgi:hypothetical protein